jgi:3-oxoacyl-[acyl-carrier-protein] synthase II
VKRRVVITGLGLLSPVGNDVATTWRALLDGANGAGPITQFDTANFPVKFGCELKGFDPLQYMDRKEVKRNDVFTQMALAASVQAMADPVSSSAPGSAV